MTFTPQSNQDYQEALIRQQLCRVEKDEKILCPHCRRTANNGIKCKGICVADSDY